MSEPAAEPAPLVSVLVPIRNEAGFIERCLESILEQTYPADRIELLVLDGMSDDGTREIVTRLGGRDQRVRLVDNPRRIVPTAMNIGIRESRGEIIIRVDGHTVVEKDFIEQSVRALREHPDAWCAGGPTRTVNETYVGRAISAAMSSPVGVGNAMFRLGGYEGYVDTIAFGAYWRWVFEKIGLFDEELVRNQDDELNYRLIKAGGRIYMTPKVRSTYFARTSLRKLWRQYYQYGFWRIRTMQKHREPATLRQVAPLAFVLIWIALIVAAAAWGPMRWALAGFAALYLLGLIAGAADVARRGRLAEAPLAPAIFPLLHFGYGLGSLAGVVHFLVLRRGGESLQDMKISR